MLAPGDLISLMFGVVVAPLSAIEFCHINECVSLDMSSSPTFLEAGDVMMLIQIIRYPESVHLVNLCICLVGGRDGLFWCPEAALRSASTLINHT